MAIDASALRSTARTLMTQQAKMISARLIAMTASVAIWTQIVAPASYFLRAVEIDSTMLLDPQLETIRHVNVFSGKLKPLWLEALASDEQELVHEAADAFAEAHRLGMQDMEDVVQPLLDVLGSPMSNLSVRLAVARALIEIDARSAAPALAHRAAVDGLEMAELVEPVLARCKYAPMRRVWLERVNDPASSGRALLLAIEALRHVQEPLADSSLRRLAFNELLRADVRLAAARTLSAIQSKGSLDDVAQLLSASSNPPVVNRLVAAHMIANDETPNADNLLRQIIDDPDPAVAAVALEAIVRRGSSLSAETTGKLVNSGDVKIRRLTAELLIAEQSPGAVDLLARLLADPHPGLRTYACDSLGRSAKREELGEPVRKAIAKYLQSSHPEAVTQAALAAGAVGYQGAIDSLIKLLDDSHSGVPLASAWALRKLANPDTASAILAKIERETQHRVALVEKLRPIVAADPYGEHDFPTVDDSNAQLAQLILALALMKSDAAEPLFRKFIPKPPRPKIGEPPVLETERQTLLRAAAIWGLGVYHGDKAPEELRLLLRERLGDVTEKDPEHPLVRRMTAISLGRMKDQAALEIMRPFCTPPKAHTELGLACRWAVREISREPLDELPAIAVAKTDWFLTPVDP